MKKVTSTDIKKALSNVHHKEFFITECKNGSTYFPPAQGLLQFDGMAIYKSWTSPKVRIYEIKVSRGDFLRDNKYHLYLQYCHEMYFIVPKGLVKKEEIPENIGLMYYNPENGSIRTVKKALYRGDIEISADMLMYIIMNRLDSDRIPFYKERCEFARDYIADKKDRKTLGHDLGSKMAKDLQKAYDELDRLKNDKFKIDLFDKIQKVLKKHELSRWGWWRDDEEIIEALDKALSRSYPKELDDIRQRLVYDLEAIDKIKEGYKNGES